MGFRITAKENIKFSIAFEAKSDWASGFFRTLKTGGGAAGEVDRTDIAAGTVDEPVIVNKTVEVQLKAGEVLLFYFGNDTTDWRRFPLQPPSQRILTATFLRTSRG